jgi:imidazolonepropionase-like amidohydrolase
MAARGVYACPTTSFRLASLAERRGGDWLERRLDAVAQMRAAGVRLAFGTDCGIPNVVHDRWAGGLIWFQQSGLSPVEVIHVATGSAAACIGLGDQVGTLTVGKAADLIAVDGDPTADLRVLERVTWVLQGGRVVA